MLMRTGTWGFNWEVCNLFDLVEKQPDGGDGSTVHHFLSAGSEGGNTTLHQRDKWQLWSEGDIRLVNGTARFIMMNQGISDWGDGYALCHNII
jgi:beta-fructofuranosidase